MTFAGADAVRAAAKAMPWEHYAPAVLIQRAVLSWNPPRQSPTVESDPELVQWLAREIVRLSNPRLFDEEVRR
ncbi:MAG TPA: hypothetical protein VIK60_01780 [Vicinamibacterales bacterium]